MANIAFDLDETLGRFSTPDYHLIFLDPTAIYSGRAKAFQPFHPTEQLRERLNRALTRFAECLASDDTGKKLLRPGILEIVKKLSDAKDIGQVNNIVVYSNNGNLNSLKLATRMIEFLLKKPGIFCDHIHFYHPIRQFGDMPNMRNPGNAYKTWSVFRYIFAQKCRDNEAIPSSSYFFDDIIHPDILRKITETNYFNVNKYRKDVPFEIIEKCFETAIKSEGLDTDPEYYKYIRPLTGRIPENIQSILNFIKRANRNVTVEDPPFDDDTSIIMERLEKLFPSPEPTPGPIPEPIPVISPTINTNSITAPFNVGTSINSSSRVPFFGGKRRRKYSKRHSSKKQKKLRKGTRKN